MLLAPSILSANFLKLEEEINAIEKGGCDLIHLDIMDGDFVPNISYGPGIVSQIRKITDLPLDSHLMVNRPERYIKDFVKSGVNYITIHPEATLHLHRTIQEIKSYGVKAGLALNPATPIEILDYIIEDLDLILIMSVNPGFGGQSYIESSSSKIRRVREMIESRNLDIILQVDGGVKLDNLEKILSSGANSVVVGSAIYDGIDPELRTKEFKSICKKYKD